MQPQAPLNTGTPAVQPALDRVQVGMIVVDFAGTQTGTVSAVQPAGSDVRPDTVAGIAEGLMASGYFRIDGTGFLTNDVYAGAQHVATISSDEPPVIELTVVRDELPRSES